MGIGNKIEIARRICPVLFMLDTSGSMSGAPIGAVNAAVEGVLPELVSMNNDNTDTKIQIGIMTFDSAVNWVTGDKELADPASYKWKDLNAFGGTSMGAGFEKLNKALSVSTGMMDHATGSVAPVLFLLSDGEPTDDYKKGLSALQENNWYKVAARVAIGYGENSNDEVLREFTGNTETVLHSNDPFELKNLIRFVTITSSMVASKGRGAAGTAGKKGKAGQTPENPDDTTNAVADALKTSAPGLSATTDPDEEW